LGKEGKAHVSVTHILVTLEWVQAILETGMVRIHGNLGSLGGIFFFLAVCVLGLVPRVCTVKAGV
jgi:hypothetical protein